MCSHWLAFIGEVLEVHVGTDSRFVARDRESCFSHWSVVDLVADWQLDKVFRPEIRQAVNHGEIYIVSMALDNDMSCP